MRHVLQQRSLSYAFYWIQRIFINVKARQECLLCVAQLFQIEIDWNNFSHEI